MGDALKPCPWCQNDKFLGMRFDVDEGTKFWHAACEKCGATGPDALSSDEAAAQWNTRAPSPLPSVEAVAKEIWDAGLRPVEWTELAEWNREFVRKEAHAVLALIGGE